jgi:hypothetical protein
LLDRRCLIPFGGLGGDAREEPMKDGHGDQSEKIAGLEDGLRGQDRQRGGQKAKSAADPNGDRNKKQKRHKRQQNPDPEHHTGQESYDRERDGSVSHSDVLGSRQQ